MQREVQLRENIVAKGSEYPGNPGSTATAPRVRTELGPSGPSQVISEDHLRTDRVDGVAVMTVAESLGPFVGRAAEMGALRAELATVRSGTTTDPGRAG